jgi:CPA2 family monovalent cation:H+ antiporter-2
LLLGPGGEFAFVGITMAAAVGLVDRGAASFVLVVTSVTMAFSPLLGAMGRRVRLILHKAHVTQPELTVRPPGGHHHAIIVGYGRVGKVVCSLFEEHRIPFIVADYDSATVTRDRRAGKEVYFGNAADVEFLKSCGLMEAAGVVITINAHDTIDDIVRRVRFMRPDILIVARARDADHARHLYAIGATEAVPETIEASFQLSEAALVGLGVAMGPAIASVHEKRDVFRSELRDAARKAGRGESYSARRRTLRAPKPSPD